MEDSKSQPAEVERKSISLEATILDLLSGLTVIVRESQLFRSDISQFPLEFMSSRGEINLKPLSSVSSAYRFYRDDVLRHGVIIRDVSTKIQFDSVDTFLSGCVNDFKHELVSAETYLIEPSQKPSYGKLTYVPEDLGFPFAQMFSASAVDNAIAQDVHLSFVPLAVNTSFPNTVTIGTYDYAPTAIARQRLLSYARSSAGRTRAFANAAIHNENITSRISKPSLPTIDPQFDILCPSVLPNEVMHVLDGFECSSILRFESIAKISGFDVTMQPLPIGSVSKNASLSVNSATYLTDIANISYDSSMTSEISAYLHSWLTPGEILFDVIYEEISPDDIEYLGIAALLVRAGTMYDENSTFYNITERGVRETDKHIRQWGLYKEIIEKITPSVNTPFPLNNHKMRRNIPSFKFCDLQVTNGVAGTNVGIIGYAQDEMAGLYSGSAPRRNYAINIDHIGADDSADYDLADWRIAASILTFVSKATGRNYAPLIRQILARMLSFYIRLNSHLRIYWYSIFRNSPQVQNARNFDNGTQTALHVPIRVKTLLYIFKSVGVTDLLPRYSFIEKMKKEASFILSFVKYSLMYRLVEHLCSKFSCHDEITPKAIYTIINSDDAIVRYVMCHLEAHNETSLLGRHYLSRYSHLALSLCYHSLTDVSMKNLIPKGVLPEYIIRPSINYIDKITIDHFIQYKTHFINNIVTNPVLTLTGNNIKNVFATKSFKAIIAKAGENPVLLRFPTPYIVTHNLDDWDESTGIEHRQTDSISIRECIRFRPVKVVLVSFNPTNYSTPDSYVTKMLHVTSAYLTQAMTLEVFIVMDEFNSNRPRYYNVSEFLAGSHFRFRSNYE